MRLDLATVLVQWGAGGLACCFVTTRRRVVGLGYGWLLRSVFVVVALGGFAAGVVDDDTGPGAAVRDLAALAMAGAAAAALAVSVSRRSTGVGGGSAPAQRRRERVDAMLGRRDPGSASVEGPQPREFPPTLDLVAPLLGVVAVLGAAEAVGGDFALAAGRLVTGAVFLGAVTDAMLLGHWYLVQPGLARDPIRELVRLVALSWPLEVALLLVPTGMLEVLDGTIDDGYGGLIGWMWIVCALSTLALAGVTWLALKERFYSAVMAATGLLYLAILTAFGTDVMARAVIAA